MKPVLFISHDFAAAGAQLLLLRLVQWLRAQPSFPFEILVNAPRSAAAHASPAERDLLDGFHKTGAVHFLSDSTGAPENLDRIRAGHYGLLYANTSTLGPLLAAIEPHGTPVVSHVHELAFWTEKRTGLQAFRLQLDCTSRFIACSTPVRDYLANRHGVPGDKIEVIHACASTGRAKAARERLTREAARRQLGVPADAFTLAACGTFDWRKGADLFASIGVALKKELAPRDFRAFWIGPYGAEITKDQFDHEAETAGLGGRARLLGPQLDPYPWMIAADCFALPSREDPFPIVMLEAATLGLPIVGFEGSGGVSEFAAGGAGILVPYLDIEAFAGALARLAREPELAARLGAQGAERVARLYDEDISFRKIRDFIANLRMA